MSRFWANLSPLSLVYKTKLATGRNV